MTNELVADLSRLQFGLTALYHFLLYRMRLAALFGYTCTALKVFTHWLTGGFKPTMKMH